MTKILKIQDALLEEWREWKHVFMTCLIINLFAYGCYLVHMTYSVDDYSHIFGRSNTIVSGRWAIDFLHNVVCQMSLMPTIMPLICIVFYVLSGIGLCKLWKIQGLTRLMVIALWSTHPYLLDVYNVRFAALSLAVGYFTTATALIVPAKTKYGFIFSVILLYLALSIYQPVIGFAIAVIMVQVLLMSFRESFSAESIRNSAKLFFRYIFMLIISVIFYLVITKLIFILLDVEVNSRLQAGFISDFDQLKAKLCVLATVLFVRLGPIKEFVLPFTGKLAIFVIYLCAIGAIIKKVPKSSVVLFVLLWLVLIPLGAISFSLPLEALSLPWRVCMGLVVFFVGMFALTQESDSLLIRRSGMALGSFLIIYFILNNNTILYKQHLANQSDLIMGNRIIAKMQSLDGYQPGMQLAIVGRTQKETFSKEGKSNLEIVTEYAKHSSVRRYSLAKSAFETDWSKYSFLLDYMNLELKRCGSEKMKKARDFTANRNPWPDPSSVFIQDKMIILLLSQPDE
jgi:hypothetical protein